MPADQIEERRSFSDLLKELGENDIVIEVAGSGRCPSEGAQVKCLEAAIQESYKALAGSAQVQLETIAVVEEVAKGSLSLWLRARHSGEPRPDGSDESLLKFLARGTLAMIAWMDGSTTLQLADLQQAIRVLAWGTSITTTAHPVLPAPSELVTAISAWQKAKAALHPGDSVR